MPTYIVTEVIEYEVEANSEDEAIETIAHTENRDELYFLACNSRTAKEK